MSQHTYKTPVGVKAAAGMLGLTMIAGTRDDIFDASYEHVESCAVLREPSPLGDKIAALERGFGPSDSFEDDLAFVLGIFGKLAPAGAFWVDLTRPDVRVPVARVVAPGLRVPRAR